MPEETFDITLADVSPEDYAMLLGGLGEIMQRAIIAGSGVRLEQAGSLLEQCLVENREATRYAILESDDREYIFTDMSDELCDKLGIEIVDGQAMDAERTQSIEVEGDDE